MKIPIAAVFVAAPPLIFAAAPAVALSADGPAACYTRQLFLNWKIDNPYKAGTQKWGNLKVYEGWCRTSGGTEFRGVWSEGNRDDGGSIKIGISTHQNYSPYATYSLSRWGSGTDWNTSPVLEKDSPGSYYGWADYSGGGLSLYW